MLIERVEQGVRARFGLAVLAVLAVGAVLAFALRFVQDDAFISYRYAENLVRGYGLVWEPGVAVQGYTNLLWTLLIAGGMALGLDPVTVSYALGIACFLGTLAFLMDVVRRATGRELVAIGAAAFLLVNFTFVSYATGGLETQLQTMLVTAALWQSQRIIAGQAFGTGRLLALSAIFALAGLTRLDSAIFIAGLSAAVLVAAWRYGAGLARVAAALLGPGAVVLAGYLAFSYAVYGEPLPNTFYAKTGDGPSAAVLERGVKFVLLFFAEYGFALPAVLILAQIGTLARDLLSVAAIVIVGLWLAYVAATGGGFMEFRFLVVILPFVAFLLARAWVVFADGMTLASAARTAVLALAAMAIMSTYHAATFGFVAGVESTRTLMNNLYASNRDLVGIGRRLGAVFPGSYGEGPYIAVTAAGAVPYYSRLRALDMLGLNDWWTARNGVPVSNRPGHRRMTPLGRLVEEEVNLVMGYPVRIPAGKAPEGPICPADFRIVWDPADPAVAEALAVASIVRLPVNREHDLALIYLTEDPAVEAALASGAIERIQEGILPQCGDLLAVATVTE